ncbi:MAG: 4-alpha-glucanotransferase [Bacteroidaceae bacterium]|nr:4-alpha-glucanotransferase [Bacteroidaceae bacterium]
MTLTFHIEYRTQWGEELHVSGLSAELGEGDPTKAPVMHTSDGVHWSLEIETERSEEVTYHYLLTRNGNVAACEWNLFPRFIGKRADNNLHIHTFDKWRNRPTGSNCFLYSSAFTDCLLARKKKTGAQKLSKRTLILKAYCPQLGEGYALAVTGNSPALADWNMQSPMVMDDRMAPLWQIAIDADSLPAHSIEYKFVLYDKKKGCAVAWEQREKNRCIETLHIGEDNIEIQDAGEVKFDIPNWRGAGLAVPVFALRSTSSFGTGDFVDLKKMVDWAVVTHQKIIQILPIYDTTKSHTFTDSYPYSSISIYALHPMYLNLERMGKLKNRTRQRHFDRLKKELERLQTIDYPTMMEAKWEFFHEIYAQEGEEVLASNGFKAWYKKNRTWLMPYAAFSFLRDNYHTANFNDWPEHATYNQKEIEKLCKKHKLEIGLYHYLQYQLHCQLSEAVAYAREKGVALKGDIPIGISRDSVEAWMEPHYFNMNQSAGAPPDDFSKDGQNWSFPTYNWEQMETDGYGWWIRRFTKMAQYFDAYRIDHILGFFRIWEIPQHSVHGLLGQFAPALPFTQEEIEQFGLPFDEELYLLPYIHEEFLPELFGEYTEEVKSLYLSAKGDGRYSLLSQYDTQRKVETRFAGAGDEKSIAIRDGLYTLISNVLFLRDHRDKEKFHPRIAAAHDYIYKHALNHDQREAFNRLYEHFYYHRHNDFWREQAMKKLPALVSATRMLVCGEDLGMIPACVPEVMDELQILSLEIQRMPKTFCEFANLKENPYPSICTISTHDMATLRGWWKEESSAASNYYRYMLGHEDEVPQEPQGPLCEEVVKAHLDSPSMFTILAIQDWFSIDDGLRRPEAEAERINVPANPQNYWRYRMHLNIEQLLKASRLNNRIAWLIDQSGRNE